MIEYADKEISTFDFELEEKIFKQTFDFIGEKIGEDAFKRYNIEKGVFQGKFLLSMFECIAVGVGKNILTLNTAIPTDEVIRRVGSVWSDDDFQRRTGSGISVSSRLPVLIPMGEKLFKA